MGELRFPCPHCGQHFAGDESWAGRPLQCSACQQPFTVPAPPRPPAIHAVATRATAAPVAAAAAQPPASAVSGPQPQPREPFSTLALVSFILSLLGLTAIPGVICGHIALRQIKRRPSTRGRGFALAGVIIGYVCIALSLAMAGLFVTAILKARDAMETMAQPGSGFPVVSDSDSGTGSARPPLRPSARPAVTPVSTDPRTAPIPTVAVSGTINGANFQPNKAQLQNGILTLSQGGNGFSDTEITIFLFAKEGESLAGKKYLVPDPDKPMNPHIHARFRQGNSSNTQIVMDAYAMRLEFEQANGGTLPGKLYLELPGEYKTKVAGTFQAQLR